MLKPVSELKPQGPLLYPCIDTFSYIIGACQGGTHSNGRKTYGHTMIANPWGEVITEVINPGKGIIYAEIDLEKLYAIRKQIPCHEK